MSQSHHIRPAHRSILALCACASWAIEAIGAEELEDHLTWQWYAVEVIVLQRPAVLEATTEEKLALATLPSLPADVRTLAGRDAGAGYDLDDPTLELLALPLHDISPAEPSEPLEIDPALVIPQGEEPGTTPDIEPGLVETPEADTKSEAVGSGARGDAALDDLVPDDEIIAVEISPGAPSLEVVIDIEPPPQPPTVEELWIGALEHFETALMASSFALRPRQSLVMSDMAARIGARSAYSVLMHAGWIQPVPPRGAPDPLLIQYGLPMDDVFQLEGTLAVTIGRYLHFHANLVYREPALGLLPVSLEADGGPDWSPPGDWLELGMVMDERRRMRSGELHYLDHPKFGVIVRIDPLHPSEALSAAWTEFQTTLD
ncbi:MAG: CsiV family protein [Pseudomonadales bacterium]|jgi:hypothetical protein|nr:CsiV family protein [Pseudomonadales bacterium]MDP6471353.1 CsiV family protein [Pseudomonadales bacterium]MDP6826456.1 CsiV family protein [Pseudomonadales bacterium]MDP6970089.1 CsiV family protein [Pseudomonadales bacterium]|tara:strand:+ start:3008 stop:4129 length:1122 start_codon:yes stop_codon:yes gene_type:complete